MARASKKSVNSFLPIGSFLLVSLAAAQGHGQASPRPEPSTDCVVVTDHFSDGDHLRNVLRVELGGLGVALSESDSQRPDCYPVTIEAVSDTAAVVELSGGRSRVVDLSSIAEELRQRSLALAIAEELSSLRADAPTLRGIPDPSEQTVSATTPPAPNPEPSGPVDPPQAANVDREQVSIVAGIGGGRFWASDQSFARGYLGAELDLEDWIRPRATLEFGYGAQTVDPFGAFSATLLGASFAWRFTVFESGPIGLLVLPDVSLALLWVQADASNGASARPGNAVSTTLMLHLTAQLQVQLATNVFLELGPTFGVVPVCARVRGEASTIGGVCGVYTGGRIGIRVGL